MGRVVTEAPKQCVVPILGWAQLGPLKLEKCRGWGEWGKSVVVTHVKHLFLRKPSLTLHSVPLLFHSLIALIKIIMTQLVT